MTNIHISLCHLQFRGNPLRLSGSCFLHSRGTETRSEENCVSIVFTSQRMKRWLERLKYAYNIKSANTPHVRSLVHRTTTEFKHRLRCVIPVVLSNNKNKLMVHMYTVTNTTIFLIVRLRLLRYNYMFRPSMLAIFRLYMKHLTISYIYM